MVARFPTGLAHFVYDVTLDDGRRCVARLTRPAHARAFAAALTWHERLAPLGVPLPAVIHADVAGSLMGFPLMLLERLPGTDLGAVYATLTQAEKRTLAGRIVDLQCRVATLPTGPGFGYAWSYDDTLPRKWRGALDRSLGRCRERIRAAGLVDEAIVDRLDRALSAHEGYFARVPPTPFLEDVTTKNVIVHRGRLSGIVDVDMIAFGDPLIVPALTRMSLLAEGHDTDYVDDWLGAMGATAEQRAVFEVYTAQHCVVFLSEFGHAFNQVSAPPVDQNRVESLLATLDRLLDDA